MKHIMYMEILGFPGVSVVKNLSTNIRDTIQSLGQEDTLEKEMSTHFSILAWIIPWTEEPSGPQSMGLQRVRHDLMTKQQWQLCGNISNSTWLLQNTVEWCHIFSATIPISSSLSSHSSWLKLIPIRLIRPKKKKKLYVGHSTSFIPSVHLYLLAWAKFTVFIILVPKDRIISTKCQHNGL